jgi:hypothetical protein
LGRRRVAPASERTAAAYRAAKGMHAPYLVHDADALGAGADAWVRWFDQQARLAQLASGRWWPPLDQLLDGVDRLVPDQL